MNNAHLAGIRHPRSTGETALRCGSDASFEDFSLFALWAVDSASRWTWLLTLNKRRVVAGRLLIGACSSRLRKSEGSLLRHPVHWNIKTAGLQTLRGKLRRALRAMLLWVGTVQARPAPPPPPNPTLRCQQSKLAAQGDLDLCLALNSANMLKGALDHSAECQQGLTKALATIDALAAKEGTACRYVDNHDGTVSDLNTALMWEQTTGTIGGPHQPDSDRREQPVRVDDRRQLSGRSGVHGVSGYAEQRRIVQRRGSPSPITGCFASHCDWRLPSIVELQEIVDASATDCGSGGPCIDPAFGPTQSVGYWSSDTISYDPTSAWSTDFAHADVTYGLKAGYHRLRSRAVRSGL